MPLRKHRLTEKHMTHEPKTVVARNPLSRFRAKRAFCRSGCASARGPHTVGALIARILSARRCRRTNGTSLGGTHYFLWAYVEYKGFSIKTITIDRYFTGVKSARFKAECSVLHIRMFVGDAAENDAQRV